MEGDGSTRLLLVFTLMLLLVYGALVLLTVALLRSRESVLDELQESNPEKVLLAQRILASAEQHLFNLHILRILLVFVIGAGIVKVLATTEILTFLTQSVHLEWRVFTIFLVSLVVVFLLILGAGIIRVSQAIAFSYPEKVLLLSARPLLFMDGVLSHFSSPTRGLFDALLRITGLPVPVEREFVRSADEISEMVERSSEAGTIEEQEGEMIQGVFSISDTLVREVMTPRADIVAVNHTQPIEEILKCLVTHGFSRVLVVGKDLDDVKGVLLSKDLLPYVGKELSRIRLDELIRPVIEIPLDSTLDQALRSLQQQASHFAVVVDEHGGVAGVVTLEDLIEEIVGDIFDEFDIPEEEAAVQQTRSGDLLVDGSMSLDDLNEMHGFQIPAGEYDTVAGFVIQTLGRIPERGEVVEYDGLRMQVEELVQNRVVLLRISALT